MSPIFSFFFYWIFTKFNLWFVFLHQASFGSIGAIY
ncbi:hypothetical protein V6Z11_D01G132400 [Gossypium hirsutum]